ncbi:hypothetical protein AKJ47_02285 [candidate division MSBL1 archaeon SCGC-AAA261G05]|uniref:A-type ATP synthase subunit F n=2 Tax=candidate division MSBL1 TaxID=215777 RepID=A0A133VAG0_9EURY|nr:hypothetical protein AKJ47_02285 [candidate division MSBL1 archaeon SCGC-AAA261G05]KXB04142.1 hypothetical protein AKJ48_03315 [candidate division MSBL1 archaeon SCGC-AAA261O19]
MEIASITDPTTAIGLRLAGVREAHEVEDWREAEEIFEEMLGEREVGIIILTERLAQKMGEKVLELKEERGITPIIVEIPDKEGALPERAEAVREIVKRAVGVEVER